MASARAFTPATVLFDLDGTLIDTIELILSSARHAFEGWPRPAPTDEQWMRGIGTPLVAQLREYAADDAEVALLLDRYRSYQLEHHDRLTRAYDGVHAVIERLKQRGHPLGVVTSKANAIARRSLAFVGLEHHFGAIVGFDDTDRHKPHPEPVRAALRLLGTDAGNAVFVGDSPYDVVSGNAAGVTTIAALWGPFDRNTLAAARPHYLIACMPELPDLLERVFGR